jgi:hypothetical protein
MGELDPGRPVIRFQAEDRVEVFDPYKQRFIPGTVTGTYLSAVLVSLDDRMIGEMVDPADSHKIRPLEVQV